MNLQEYAEKRFSEDKELVRIEVCGSKFGLVGRFINKDGEYTQDCIIGIDNGDKFVIEARFERPEIKSYPCVTSIDSDGDILFNDGKQGLYVSDGIYRVLKGDPDRRDLFEWVPCKREDLKSGDTAWATNIDEAPSKKGNIAKVLDEKNYVYVKNDKNIIVDSVDFKNWFKLVRR